LAVTGDLAAVRRCRNALGGRLALSHWHQRDVLPERLCNPVTGRARYFVIVNEMGSVSLNVSLVSGASSISFLPV
jgi:hypothetical protein